MLQLVPKEITYGPQESLSSEEDCPRFSIESPVFQKIPQGKPGQLVILDQRASDYFSWRQEGIMVPGLSLEAPFISL